MCGVSLPNMNWDSSNLPEAWDKFRRHTDLVFSGPLKSKTEEEKVSYFLLWVGDKGRDIRATWTDITNDDAKKLDTFYTRFKDYVQPKLNPIFARFKFNNIIQGSDSVEKFVTKLRLAAADCRFDNPDEMIRDRIVFGCSSLKLREKLINIGENLTLDKALETAQTFEYSREQLKAMASDGSQGASGVDHVRRQRPHSDNTVPKTDPGCQRASNRNSVPIVELFISQTKNCVQHTARDATSVTS